MYPEIPKFSTPCPTEAEQDRRSVLIETLRKHPRPTEDECSFLHFAECNAARVGESKPARFAWLLNRPITPLEDEDDLCIPRDACAVFRKIGPILGRLEKRLQGERIDVFPPRAFSSYPGFWWPVFSMKRPAETVRKGDFGVLSEGLRAERAEVRRRGFSLVWAASRWR